MRILGLIPARGGSKGLPRKNILPLDGIPLIAHSIRAGQAAPSLTTLIVSTDDAEIAEVATQHGAWVPFLRPAALAADESSSVDVALHALDFMAAEHGQHYDALLLLQPTAPLRQPQDIEDAIALYQRTGANTVISLTPVESVHPYYMYRMPEDHAPVLLLPEASQLTRRQDYPPIYLRNGAIYLTDCAVLRESRSFYGERLRAIVMPPERSTNIDSLTDLAAAEALLRLQHGATPASGKKR